MTNCTKFKIDHTLSIKANTQTSKGKDMKIS